MDIIITIKPYLQTLKAEQSKSETPLKVPNLRELAEAIGLSEKHFLRYANNQIKEHNLEVYAKTIAELRRRGFDTDVGDLLRYVE